MPLTLLVPDLLPPPNFPVQWPATPGLATLLARGRLERGGSMAMEDWLLSAFSLSGQPVGALRALATPREPGMHGWLCVDPVHLRIERDHLQLVSAAQFPLTQDESDALIATLNAHLQQDALSIEAATPSEWLMRVPADKMPATTPLWKAVDRSVFELLPQPAGGRDWKALGNEIQMLLHDHPVNQARESRGEPAISGVWFWGGDPLPVERSDASILAPEFIHADDTLTRGLAAYALSDYLMPPARYADWVHLDTDKEKMSLVVLDDLSRAVRAHDSQAWMDGLARLERDWFDPAMRAVWNKSLAMVRAVFPGERATHYLHVSRGDLWKLWRSKRPPETTLNG